MSLSQEIKTFPHAIHDFFMNILYWCSLKVQNGTADPTAANEVDFYSVEKEERNIVFVSVELVHVPCRETSLIILYPIGKICPYVTYYSLAFCMLLV